MDIATLLAYFVFGNITGAVGIVILTLFLSKRALDKLKKEAESKGKTESIKSRMDKVKGIIAEQLDLQNHVVGPQKNALHGKYKNGLNSRIKELELEKTDILKSIIADGFDPEITVIDGSGVVTTIKLSEFLINSGISMPPKGTKLPPEQVGKFTVYRGGKDDGGNTTH